MKIKFIKNLKSTIKKTQVKIKEMNKMKKANNIQNKEKENGKEKTKQKMKTLQNTCIAVLLLILLLVFLFNNDIFKARVYSATEHLILSENGDNINEIYYANKNIDSNAEGEFIVDNNTKKDQNNDITQKNIENINNIVQNEANDKKPNGNELKENETKDNETVNSKTENNEIVNSETVEEEGTKQPTTEEQKEKDATFSYEVSQNKYDSQMILTQDTNKEYIFNSKDEGEDNSYKIYTIKGQIQTHNINGKHIVYITMYQSNKKIKCITTNIDGSFNIDIKAGTYDLKIEKEGYLDYMIYNIKVENENINLGIKQILGGDVVKDGIIEIDDVVSLTDNYGTIPIIDEYSTTEERDRYNNMIKYDLNGDGEVDKLDMEILKQNYGMLNIEEFSTNIK